MVKIVSANLKEFNEKTFANEADLKDTSLSCIDCGEDFVWSIGEQIFFRDKGLLNPPKRCRDCKQAKNNRINAIYTAQQLGVAEKIEVAVYCARCNGYTTVPFYPSQGRPVFCRSCFLEMNSQPGKGDGEIGRREDGETGR